MHDYLVQTESANADVTACYQYQGGKGGHVVLFDRVLSPDVVQIVDPSQEQPVSQLDRVGLQEFHQKITAYGTLNMSGLWEFSVT